jgi:hypothetical protein
LREEIRSGHAKPERKLAVCAGGASMSPEDRAEALAVLSADSDPAIADRAKNVLLTQPVESILVALGRIDADPRLFTYCADNLAEKRGMADALAANSKCPSALVARVAPYLTAAGIHALLEDLDRLTLDPRLLAALLLSNAAMPEQRELLEETQKGALLVPSELDDAAAEVVPDKAKRLTLLARLSQMTVVDRIQLAIKGGREERMLLIRDPNKIVQRGVLQSARLTDSEVESFAAMTNLTAEVLRLISLNRAFMKNYVVVKNLARNPKTPLDISLRLLQRLTAPDLKLLTTNKNIPETLKSTAVKLHRQRSAARTGQ